MKFYCESGEKALEELASKKDGLSSAEAEKRLSENGKNKLIEGKKAVILQHGAAHRHQNHIAGDLAADQFFADLHLLSLSASTTAVQRTVSRVLRQI